MSLPLAQAAGGTILVYGDSLSAGYGLARGQGWVGLLEERLRQGKFKHRVVNASISGETSAGGLSRIGRALDQHRPAVMILALGANDGLRGLPVSQMTTNLDGILRAAKARRVHVLLVGMHMPPNYGPVYTEQFAVIYRGLSERFAVPLVPRMLDQVAEHRELMQSDGIHPTAEAQSRIMKNIWNGLEPMLDKTATIREQTGTARNP